MKHLFYTTAGAACRRAGITGSAVDFAVRAAAMHRNRAIFTIDRDFTRYARHLSIQLHTLRPT